MTTARIDTFQDLLNLLDEKPAWVTELRVRLLTPDLIALPAQLTRFAAETNQRLGALEGLPAQVEDLKAQFAQFAAETNRRLDALEGLPAQVEDLKARTEADVQELKEGQARLETDVQELKEGQARLETYVQELKEGQARTEAGQNRMQGEINNLRGDKYERRITRYITLTARRNLNMRQVRVLLGEFTPDNNELADLLTDAEDNRQAITAEQGQDLERTDIIIAGVNRADGTPLYAVIEVAVTLNRDDISRAQRRAGVLAAATGHSVLPAVIGSTIDEIDRRRADAAGVGLVIIHE